MLLMPAIACHQFAAGVLSHARGGVVAENIALK